MTTSEVQYPLWALAMGVPIKYSVGGVLIPWQGGLPLEFNHGLVGQGGGSPGLWYAVITNSSTLPRGVVWQRCRITLLHTINRPLHTPRPFQQTSPLGRVGAGHSVSAGISRGRTTTEDQGASVSHRCASRLHRSLTIAISVIHTLLRTLSLPTPTWGSGGSWGAAPCTHATRGSSSSGRGRTSTARGRSRSATQGGDADSSPASSAPSPAPTSTTSSDAGKPNASSISATTTASARASAVPTWAEVRKWSRGTAPA